MKRKQWFTLHSWAGLQFSLLLCFVLVTGTLATISRDIDWLLNPAMRSIDDVAIKDVNWPALFDKATQQCAECALQTIEVSKDSWFSAETTLVDKSGDRFRLFQDRASGEVTGTGAYLNVHRFIRQLHRHLMMPKPLGITLVCLMFIPLLIAFISSMVVYKNWYKLFFTLPRLSLTTRSKLSNDQQVRRKNRQLWRELHKFSGIWILWFMLIIILTGGWYLAEQWGLEARYPEEPPKEFHQDSLPKLSKQGLESLLLIARQTYPSLLIDTIELPTVKRPYIVFEGQAEAVLVRSRANHIALDVKTGEVLSVLQGEKMGVHLRISEAADPLHFGDLAGGLTRWLWFVCGVMLSGIAISGVYLWVNRRFSQHTSTDFSYLHSMWLAMTWARWPVTVLIVTSLILSAYTFYA